MAVAIKGRNGDLAQKFRPSGGANIFGKLFVADRSKRPPKTIMMVGGDGLEPPTLSV